VEAINEARSPIDLQAASLSPEAKAELDEAREKLCLE